MLESSVAYLSIKFSLKKDKLKLTVRNLGRAFNFRCGCPIDKAVLYTDKKAKLS
jgi:hypothetical protein